VLPDLVPPSPAALARAVQGLLRSVASAKELLDAAAMIQKKHPDLAEFLRTYGTGRTSDVVAHAEANAHLL